MRVVIVGGGVLGTMHAWQAVTRGHHVVQLEREAEARVASVRNFGLVWVSGRSAPELSTALRARELWAKLGADVPPIGFRPCGSLTVVRTPAELAVAEAALRLSDADERGFALLDADQTRHRNPALRGELLGALWCERDAAVEPRPTQRALHEHMGASGRYTFLGGREVRHVTGTGVVDDTGVTHDGDLVVLCPGATLTGLARELCPDLPLRKVRLQMLQTQPLAAELTTSVADADSFRYYPAFAGPELEELRSVQPQPPVAARYRSQLLMVQRADGGLTIGDTHDYDEPFPFDSDEEPYQHLRCTAEDLLGVPLPPVRHRWTGVYAQCTDPNRIVLRERVADGVWLVAGPGGRGMTISPAVAEHTADLAGM